MKKLILLVVSVAVAASSFAGQKGGKIACAVMPDHKLDIAKATKDKMFADYKGRRYFFCCAGCPAAFKKDPAKFAKAPSIPTPKSK